MALRSIHPWERVDKTLTKNYKVCRKIGRGCYGLVWEVRTKRAEEPQLLAAKKVLYAFKDAVDAQRTYREVAYLLEFGHHENILGLRDIVAAADDRHLYIITELLQTDLQKALRCNALQEVHRPLVAYQVLRALKYLHSGEVMHRDIKPSNILLDSNCQAVLCDFGWARASPDLESTSEPPTTDYAATRWYRAPEMLLGGKRYTTMVDIWACACVIGEMNLGRPLMGGTSTIDMLQKIEEIFGKPLPADSEAMGTLYATLAFEACPEGPPYKPLEAFFSSEDEEELVDFLKLLMQYNPQKRMLASEALKHPYLGQYHNPDDEPVHGRKVLLKLPDTERFTAAYYRDEIYKDFIGHAEAWAQTQEAGESVNLVPV